MNSGERLLRIAEIEGIVAQLVELGWEVQDVSTCDERNEPLTVSFTLFVEGESSLGDAL